MSASAKKWNVEKTLKKKTILTSWILDFLYCKILHIFPNMHIIKIEQIIGFIGI